jgi:CHASE1-domain containing sensor protein
MAKAEHTRWQGYALLVVGALLTLGFLLGHFNSQRLQGGQEALLEAASKEISDSFRTEMQHAIDIVESTTWLFYASNSVDRDEFQSFAANALRTSPIVKELRWSPKVTDDHRDAFVSQAREQGLKEFELKEQGATPTDLFKSRKRDQYFPLFYIYPQSDDRLGLDVYSRTNDRWAMHAALERGRPVATAVSDVAPYGNRMLIYVPVFEALTSGAAVPDPAKLVGYVTAVVTLDSLVNAMRQKVEQMGIDVLLFDNTHKMHQLLAYLPSKPSQLSAEEAAIEYRIAKSGSVLSVNVADRNWEFVMHPNQAASGSDEALVWMLVAGLLVIGILVMATIRSRMARIAADTTGA